MWGVELDLPCPPMRGRINSIVLGSWGACCYPKADEGWGQLYAITFNRFFSSLFDCFFSVFLVRPLFCPHIDSNGNHSVSHCAGRISISLRNLSSYQHIFIILILFAWGQLHIAGPETAQKLQISTSLILLMGFPGFSTTPASSFVHVCLNLPPPSSYPRPYFLYPVLFSFLLVHPSSAFMFSVCFRFGFHIWEKVCDIGLSYHLSLQVVMTPNFPSAANPLTFTL